MEEQSFSKYEKARIIGARALQISMNAPLLIKIEEDEIDMELDVFKQALKHFVFCLELLKNLKDGCFESRQKDIKYHENIIKFCKERIGKRGQA